MFFYLQIVMITFNLGTLNSKILNILTKISSANFTVIKFFKCYKAFFECCLYILFVFYY